MARRLCLALGLLTTVVLAFSTANAAPMCSRDLHVVLDSPACSSHMATMASDTRLAIDGSTVRGACIDSLRELFVSAVTPTPCAMHLASLHHTRQLYVNPVTFEETFDGKLNCTFDKSAPLDLSNLNQSFVIVCKELKNPYNYTWVYIVLGVLGGCCVLTCLYVLISGEIQNARDNRRARLREEAKNEAKAAPASQPHELA